MKLQDDFCFFRIGVAGGPFLRVMMFSHREEQPEKAEDDFPGIEGRFVLFKTGEVFQQVQGFPGPGKHWGERGKGNEIFCEKGGQVLIGGASRIESEHFRRGGKIVIVGIHRCLDAVNHFGPQV